MTVEQIVLAAGSLVTVATFCGICYNAFKKATRTIISQEMKSVADKLKSLEGWNTRQQKDIETSFAEKEIMLKGILACLKGLQEKGCNGPVTKAISELEDFLFVHAHEGVSRKL